MKITEKDLYDIDGKIHFEYGLKGRMCLYVPKLNALIPLTMLVNALLKLEKQKENQKERKCL
jgi:hypothetical protein